MIGVILSGGENTRMPFLKGFLKIDDTTIIERNLAILGKVFEEVVISTNMPEKYFGFGVPMIGDIKKEKGPMTGILSVLAATGADAVFVAACDMPFISEELIRYMVEKYRMQDNKNSGIAVNSPIPNPQPPNKRYDAVIPVFNGRPEPLFGIYTRNTIKPMEKALEEGAKGLNELLKNIDALFISDSEVKDIDPEGKSFVNINTIADYEKIGGVLCLV